MEKKIESLEKSVSFLSNEINEIKGLLSGGLKKVESNFESITKEINSLHLKVDSLNKKVEALQGDTTEGFGDVGLKLETLTEEINKISIVTRYEDQYDNLKAVK